MGLNSNIHTGDKVLVNWVKYREFYGRWLSGEGFPFAIQSAMKDDSTMVVKQIDSETFRDYVNVYCEFDGWGTWIILELLHKAEC